MPKTSMNGPPTPAPLSHSSLGARRLSNLDIPVAGVTHVRWTSISKGFLEIPAGGFTKMLIVSVSCSYNPHRTPWAGTGSLPSCVRFPPSGCSFTAAPVPDDDNARRITWTALERIFDWVRSFPCVRILSAVRIPQSGLPERRFVRVLWVAASRSSPIFCIP